eukprot:Tamp_24948.p1 GENE.Tamp_24948~~Tamp_24948.p1  ORF type:complete len:238 (+),score=80.72 Tamp_24948:196-909(+)
MGACFSSQDVPAEWEVQLQKDAPALSKYFAIQANHAKYALEADPIALIADADMAQQFNADLKRKEARMVKSLQRLARESFKRHDKDGNGVLDKEESQLFFNHYTRCFFEFQKMYGEAMAKAASIKMLKMCSLMGGPEGDVRAAIAAKVREMKEDIALKLANYKQNQLALNEKAFQVVDVDGDGKLQEQEVVDALTPKMERNKQLHLALGLMSQQEIELSKGRAVDHGAELQAQCAQQ